MSATLEAAPEQGSDAARATREVVPEQGSDAPVGTRERRRLEQQRRARRRYRHAAVGAAGAFALVVALAGVVAGIGALVGDPPDPPASAPAEAPADADTPADAAAAAEADAAAAAEADAAAAEAPADGLAEAPAAGAAEDDDRVRLQLLNGVGTPGVAERVEEQLPEAEFRVVVADNAPEFGVRKTRLLVYDDDPASLAAAERLREVLGAGTISVSRQPQSVVDVTVIIGRDVDRA